MGGHGDDDDEQKRQSVWVAESYNDKRMLRWSDLQPKLQLHPSEILLLLDYYYASQAARGSKSPIPDNVELFVACGLNTKTVLQGEQSFTSQLLQEIKDSLESNGLPRYRPLLSTWSNESQHNSTTASSSNRTPTTPLEARSLTIRLSLSKSEQHALNEIIQWLKFKPPSTVSNIRVEQLRISANAVGDYISGISRSMAVTAFNNLSASARQACGLIWRVPPGSRKYPISLLEVISKKIQVLKKLTLGQRFRIAYKIGTAILKCHLVNWVHQGIASYNIVFFYDEIDGVGYDNLYLCGFEYSRKKSATSTSLVVEQFGLKFYRHPDRQGIPNASHQKEHEIYSYGVLLLELGLWDTVGKLFRSRKDKEILISDMGVRIQDTARKELGHCAGGAYQRATSLCLHGDLGVGQDDKVYSQMAKAFETRVLKLIKVGTTID